MSESSAADSPQNPLHERYASTEMRRLFSTRHRYLLWRRLWIVLAESQRELGLPITADQIARLESVAADLDLERVAAIERETRHDVVAHLRHFAEQAGEAGGILHLGATSAFITDNADSILSRDALKLIERRLGGVIRTLALFADRTRSIPTLGYTHLQPAQLTTVGKRASLWLQDLVSDLAEVRRRLAEFRCRGAKGTTGTQASYLALFDGDHDAVRRLDETIAAKLGFTASWPLTGQTYPRKQDSQVLATLAGIAESTHKMGTDIRLLQGLGVLAEPFDASQVGSSAMAYKRNPIRSERMCALARRLITDSLNGPLTAATQWLERSLDDSANRRLVLPDSFLVADAVLAVATSVATGMTVRDGAVRHLVERELPFMATENILMRAVKHGGDRQALHEKLRQYSLEAHQAVERGKENPLVGRLAADPDFALSDDDVKSLLDPVAYIGRAPEQVKEFLADLARLDLPENVELETLRV
ncbi:MAG: adenylosuccinate lyase [Acidobacteriota bacterium]|nr:adenylosuccinate lyase [Acidobacteriota bacterium]